MLFRLFVLEGKKFGNTKVSEIALLCAIHDRKPREEYPRVICEGEATSRLIWCNSQKNGCKHTKIHMRKGVARAPLCNSRCRKLGEEHL